MTVFNPLSAITPMMATILIATSSSMRVNPRFVFMGLVLFLLLTILMEENPQEVGVLLALK